jgi:hypothetical protein
MLPVIERGQAVDRTRAYFVGVALAAFGGLQNSPGDDFAIHFELTDVLKRLTRKVVRLVHGQDFLRIEEAMAGTWIERGMMLLVAGASAGSRN